MIKFKSKRRPGRDNESIDTTFIITYKHTYFAKNITHLFGLASLVERVLNCRQILSIHKPISLVVKDVINESDRRILQILDI